MRPELQADLVARVLEHVERRTTDMDVACGNADVASYVEPAQLERERACLFRKLPLLVGHRAMIAAPGDFYTQVIDDVPLLVVRGDDLRAHVYLNVCRHRGTRVESSASGCGKERFACPYHGWTYGRDGRVSALPHCSGFPHLSVGSTGLVELPSAEHAGFLFCRLTPSAELATPDAFSVIEEDLAGWDVASHHVYSRRTIHKALNWKLAIDIFLEAYHLRSAHAGSIYEMFFDNLAVVDPIGPHTRNIFPKRSIRHLAGTARDEWRIREHANVLYHLFPNALLLFEPDHLVAMHVQPRGTDACTIESLMLVPVPATSLRARTYWDANLKILYDAIEEDFAMGESIQGGLRSGANEALTFGRFEHALSNFHRGIARLIPQLEGT